MILTVHLIRKASIKINNGKPYCVSGIKSICEKEGLDFKQLLRGMEIPDSLGFNDSRVKKIIDIIKKKEF